MAKSLRASSKKSTRSGLRSSVFGPVEDARTARLSKKLMDLALKRGEAVATTEEPTDKQENQETAAANSTSNRDNETMQIDQSFEVVDKSLRTVRRGQRNRRKNGRKSGSSTMFRSHAAKSVAKKRGRSRASVKKP